MNNETRCRGTFLTTFRGHLLVTAILLSASAAGIADTAKAVFAGGCFWCMEADFEKLDGVADVVSGFSGGAVKNPTYNGDHAGHYEVIEVTYDPAMISYRDLLDHFWVNVDPFDAGGQFCDRGDSYRTGIFVADAEQRRLAERSKAQVSLRFPDQTVVTPILDAATFYPVKGDESYHQDFYKKNPWRYQLYRWNCGRDQRLAEIWMDTEGESRGNKQGSGPCAKARGLRPLHRPVDCTLGVDQEIASSDVSLK